MTKTKVSVLIACLSAVLCTALCIFSSAVGTDAHSGYVQGIGTLMYAVFLLIFAATLVLGAYINKNFENKALDENLLQGGIVLPVISVILCICFGACAIFAFRASQIPANAENKAFFVIVAVTAALSAVSTLCSALAAFGGVKNERLGYLGILPVLYYAAHTLCLFKANPLVLSVPLRLLQALSVIAILLFTLQAARTRLGIGSCKKVLVCTAFAWVAAFTFLVSNYVLAAISTAFHIAFTAEIAVDTAMLLYITAFAAKVLKSH